MTQELARADVERSADRAAQRAAETAARQAYGRLVAWLAWQWRDIAAAEDALGEAFATALERWPADGVPASPEAWLLTAARRQLLMAARRARLAADPTLTVLWPAEGDAAPEPEAIPDDRLRLLFVCAHPAIDAGMHSALMLQTVLGIDAGRIGSAFLVAPATMNKRLVRVKAKIKAAGIRFEAPAPDEMAGRLHAVLEAIYGAYTLDWNGDDSLAPLADEALYLAELVAAQLPGEAEALGLLALLWLCEARRPARLDANGDFVPLDRQDCRRWKHDQISRADRLLARAAALRRPGPLQLEAAIQAAHCARAGGGDVPWADILRLYEQLLLLAPTVGAMVGHAVAVAQAGGDPAAGLARLDSLDAARVAGYQPWWAARAHLQAVAEQADAAAASYGRALALTSDPALRRFLQGRLSALASADDGPAQRTGSTAASKR